MDLFSYLQVVRRRWVFALLGLALTTGLTAMFVDSRPPVYEARGTLVVRPRTVDPGDGLRAIETLTRGVEITSTFATIARSDLIKEHAQRRVGPGIDTSGLKVSSEVLTTTNIVEVTVSGRDPEAVHALATAVADETMDYVGDLQQAFELQILDAPELPDDPVAPNRPLLLGTGVVLGCGIGVLFAVLAEGFARPPKPRHFNEQLTSALRSNRSFSFSYGEIDISDEEAAAGGNGRAHDDDVPVADPKHDGSRERREVG